MSSNGNDRADAAVETMLRLRHASFGVSCVINAYMHLEGASPTAARGYSKMSRAAKRACDLIARLWWDGVLVWNIADDMITFAHAAEVDGLRVMREMKPRALPQQVFLDHAFGVELLRA